MIADNRHSVAFTGHRKERILQGNSLCFFGRIQISVIVQIVELYEQGYRDFYCGMAEGFDMLAATAVVQMKKKYEDIRLIAVIPFRNQSARYDEADRQQYNALLAEANEVVMLSEYYYRGCFHRRNDFLISHAYVVVAYWDGIFKGGTFYTIKKAQGMNRKIINLFK